MSVDNNSCELRDASCEKCKSHIKNRRLNRRGIGLAELLIAVAITAGLLTAVAVAIDASIKAYSINQVQSDTLHRARLAMHRLSTYIRTSTEHSPITESQIESFTAGTTVIDTGIALFDENDDELTFRYDAVNEQLIVTENDTDHILLRGVTAFSLEMTPSRSASSIKTGGGFDRLSRVTITLTLRFIDPAPGMQTVESGRTITISTSVTPRRSF